MLFSSLLEMHLQNGSVLCICSKASNLSAASGCGVVVDCWEIWGEVLGCGVEVALEKVCCVQLLVLKAGPSAEEAVSMLTDVDVEMGFINLERQSAALFLAPEIHSKVILYVASSRLHLLTLMLAFFYLETMLVAYDHFNSDVSTLQAVISLSDAIVDAIGLLFSCTPFPLGLCESVQQKCYRKFHSIVFL